MARGFIDTDGHLRDPRDSDVRSAYTDMKNGSGKSKSKLPAIPDSKEEKMELLSKLRNVVSTLEIEINPDRLPQWDNPMTWEMMSGAELAPGDGVKYQNVTCIVARKLAWWRSKSANILIHEHHNPAKFYRIGTTDYVFGFKGYVLHQRLSKMGLDDCF